MRKLHHAESLCFYAYRLVMRKSFIEFIIFIYSEPLPSSGLLNFIFCQEKEYERILHCFAA
jgi:hypothetical protein